MNDHAVSEAPNTCLTLLGHLLPLVRCCFAGTSEFERLREVEGVREIRKPKKWLTRIKLSPNRIVAVPPVRFLQDWCLRKI